jgi:hypothetical protein
VQVESDPSAPPSEVLVGFEPIGMAKGANSHVLEEIVGVSGLDPPGGERGRGPMACPRPGGVEVDCRPGTATSLDVLLQCHPQRRFAV